MPWQVPFPVPDAQRSAYGIMLALGIWVLLWVEVGESVDDIVEVVEVDEDEDESEEEEAAVDVEEDGHAEDSALLVEVAFVRDFDEDDTELQVPNNSWQFFPQYAEVDPLQKYQR